MSPRFWLSIAVIGVCVWVIGWLLVGIANMSGPPRPDAHGMIHHPVYGDYPAVVPFEQGMTIMPGQSAVMEVPVPRLRKERPDGDDQGA